MKKIFREDDANYKMNPPLRSKEDRDALIEGLLMEQLILLQQIMPHIQRKKKQKVWNLAPFGIVGLETAFPLLYTHFVEKEIFTFEQFIDLG